MPDLASPRQPELSIVIAVYNGRDDLPDCLEAIDRARRDLDTELLLVDDGSTDGSGQIAADHGARVLRIEDGPRGPAHARNLGAMAAVGETLFFTDADCIVADDTLRRVRDVMRERPDIAAVMGSYDDAPAHPAFLARFKNLFHHWVHQGASAEASTFWTGCGAIRREVFCGVGGFNEGYPKPSIEDIELGSRVIGRGHRILLDKEIVVKHQKRWRFWDLVRTDVLRRGAPWIALMMRDKQPSNDLNADRATRLATVFAGLFVLAVLLLPLFGHPAAPLPSLGLLGGATLATLLCRESRPGVIRSAVGILLATLPPIAAAWLLPDWSALLPLLLLLAAALCHSALFALFRRRYGLLFAIASLPMHFAHLCCCICSVPAGLLTHRRDQRRARLHGEGPGLCTLPPLPLQSVAATSEGASV